MRPLLEIVSALRTALTLRDRASGAIGLRICVKGALAGAGIGPLQHARDPCYTPGPRGKNLHPGAGGCLWAAAIASAPGATASAARGGERHVRRKPGLGGDVIVSALSSLRKNSWR